jgi:hypothetical protein
MATMTLTADLLMRISGAYDLELVTRLDLSGRGLRSLEGIAQCPNLTELDVSRNRIADLSPLGGLAASLERLNASGNEIRRLPQVMAQLGRLTHLRLEGNAVSTMDELRVLSAMAQLRHVHFQNKQQQQEDSGGSADGGADEKDDAEGRDGNPVCAHPAYTTTLLRYAPDLVVLDGERIKLRESSQKAMLAAMAVPAEKLEIPDKARWLEGFSWETDKSAAPAAEAAQARAGSRGSRSRRLSKDKPAAAGTPAPDIFDEAFIEKATATEVGRFDAAIGEADALDAEAEALLKTAAR